MKHREINYSVRTVVDATIIGKTMPKGVMLPGSQLLGEWVIIRDDVNALLAVTVNGESIIVSRDLRAPRGMEPGAVVPVSVDGYKLNQSNKVAIVIHCRELVSAAASKKLVAHIS